MIIATNLLMMGGLLVTGERLPDVDFDHGTYYSGQRVTLHERGDQTSM